MSVLLPAPFSPMSAWTSPAFSEKLDAIERDRRPEPLADSVQPQEFAHVGAPGCPS